MNAIPHDIDHDGDQDLVVADRNGEGTVWFESPNYNRLQPWPRHIIDERNHISFMKIADVNSDGRSDLLITTKENNSVTILERLSNLYNPNFKEHTIQ